MPTPALDADQWLDRAEARLFRSQAPADQRHAIRVACHLLAAGHSDRFLIRAALLHDVGKAGGGIRLMHRVGWVLAGRLVPPVRGWLVRRGGPWAALASHATIGASRLRHEGGDARVVALVAGRPLTGDEERARLLALADDSA